MSDTRTLRHNATVVETFVSMADKIFGAGGPGTYEMPPLSRKSRGVSRPALTPAAMKYIENAENCRTAKVVTSYIEDLKEDPEKGSPRNYYFGYDLYTLVCLCGWNTHDHGYLRNLKAPEDDEGRRELEAWNFVTMLIATKATKQLEAQGRNPKLKIVVSPKDETADSPIEFHNRENNRRRSWNAKDGYKSLSGRFRAYWDKNSDMSKAAAKEMFIKREEERALEGHRESVSVRTLERALKHCEGQAGDDVA